MNCDTDIQKNQRITQEFWSETCKITSAEQSLSRRSFVLQQDKRTNRASNVGGETIDSLKLEGNAFLLNVQEYGHSAKEA